MHRVTRFISAPVATALFAVAVDRLAFSIGVFPVREAPRGFMALDRQGYCLAVAQRQLSTATVHAAARGVVLSTHPESVR